MPFKDIEKQRAAQRRYAQENRERILASQTVKRNKMRRLITDSKNVPCADCGIQYPHYVMDFDHLPGSVKVCEVGQFGILGTIEKLQEEIDKCEVVCSNCHRHRTFMRNGSGA
jgi:hypothetical protein